MPIHTLHADLETQRFPYFTIVAILICWMVFMCQVFLPKAGWIVFAFGTVPATLFGVEAPNPEFAVIPPFLTILTSMFLHGGWGHFLSNMLVLWIFGRALEDVLGPLNFIIFYVICGVVGTMSHAVASIESTVPMVGASGALAGVMGAYILLYPTSRIRVLLLLGFVVWPVRLPAVLFITVWIALQLTFAALTDAAMTGVAWWAHIGGFVAGFFLIFVFRAISDEW